MKTEIFVLENGERIPLLLGDDGIPKKLPSDKIPMEFIDPCFPGYLTSDLRSFRNSC